MFQHLVEFKEKYGHSEVNRKFTKWGLGNWVSVQRAEGRKGILDPRRAQRLREIGMDWGEDWDQRWEEGFAMLKKFKKKHGHCRVPLSKFKESQGFFKRKLSGWVKNQRVFNDKGTILAERKKRLDKIGFAWKDDITPLVLMLDESNTDDSPVDNALSEPGCNGTDSDIEEEPNTYQALATNTVPARTVSRAESDSSDSEFEFEGDDSIVGLPQHKDAIAAARTSSSGISPQLRAGKPNECH